MNTECYFSKPKAYSDKIIAEIRAAGDGIEAAAILEDLIAEVLENTCESCQGNEAHALAMQMLPLVRPDLFAGHGDMFSNVKGAAA